jgi:hypothetical protein
MCEQCLKSHSVSENQLVLKTTNQPKKPSIVQTKLEGVEPFEKATKEAPKKIL